jgi:hypothetical protein
MQNTLLEQVGSLAKSHGFEISNIVEKDHSFVASLKPNDRNEAPDEFFEHEIVPLLLREGCVVQAVPPDDESNLDVLRFEVDTP